MLNVCHFNICGRNIYIGQKLKNWVCEDCFSLQINAPKNWSSLDENPIIMV